MMVVFGWVWVVEVVLDGGCVRFFWSSATISERCWILNMYDPIYKTYDTTEMALYLQANLKK